MPTIMPVYGLPGLGKRQSATHRIVFRQNDWLSDLSGGKLIDGVNSRDSGNTPNYVLRAGMLMGKITSGGLYAPSIIDVTAGALAGTGTSITLTPAGAAELIRRQGSSGTLSLTGPVAANGVSRTLAIAYSAVVASTGVVTTTAANANEVQTLDFANSPSGTFTLTIIDKNGVAQETAPITYSGTIATLLANIQAATDLVLATNAIVWTGTVVTAVAGTFSGTGYAGLPQALIVASALSTAGTISVTRTTAGSSGGFVAGALVGNNDGSQVPLTLIPDGYGIHVVDETFASITVPFPEFPIAGVITPTQIINYPTDTGIQAFVKNALSSSALGKYVFADGY